MYQLLCPYYLKALEGGLEQDVTSGFARLERSVGLCFNLDGSAEVESKDETFEMCCKKTIAPKVIIALEASFLDESSRY